MLGATPAVLHSRFISAQICRLDRLFPLLVRKISPEAVFCALAYFFSFRHSFPGSRMVRSLPFRAISAFPARAASTVIYFPSLTRMPVEQIVSSSRANRSRPREWAAVKRRSYSSRVSSRRSSRNSFRWSLRALILQSSQP